MREDTTCEDATRYSMFLHSVKHHLDMPYHTACCTEKWMQHDVMDNMFGLQYVAADVINADGLFCYEY
jgi:hypothetical protein